MPAVIAGIVGAVMAAVASEAEYGVRCEGGYDVVLRDIVNFIVLFHFKGRVFF